MLRRALQGFGLLLGNAVPGNGKKAENWSSADKFAVVLETASLNEAECSAYCRHKGLYIEQIQAWREACQEANNQDVNRQSKQNKDDAKRIRQLEKELQRKEKVLAEAAALLILRKKAQAIWGGPEEE